MCVHVYIYIQYWQKRAQDSEDHLVVVSREKDKLQTHVDRLQKELQQSSDYYSAYQMVSHHHSCM